MIADLIRQLDSDSTEEAEDAQFMLTGLGAEVLDPLLHALPGLDSFGQLCAIEVIEAVGDARAGGPLADLLSASGSSTVRGWAALALAQLDVTDAVPALERAYQACKDRRDPLDDSEPDSLRTALTELGARHPVIPSPELLVNGPNGLEGWPATRLPEVLASFVTLGQAALFFQLWRVEDGRAQWSESAVADTALDFYSHPWPDLVRAAHARISGTVALSRLDDDLIATIVWIGEADR